MQVQKIEKLIIDGGTVNIPIDINKENMDKFIKLLSEDSEQSKLRHNEIRILLEGILTELRRKRR